MRESTKPEYIDAHDSAWQSFYDESMLRFRRARVLPSKWDAFAAGFGAGVDYGRANPVASAEDEVTTDAGF